MQRHEVVGEFKAPGGPVAMVSISPDGKHALIGRDVDASDVVAIDYQKAEIEPVGETAIGLALFSRRLDGVAYFCTPYTSRAGGRVVGPAANPDLETARFDWLAWAAGFSGRRKAFAVSRTERFVASGNLLGSILVWDLSEIPLKEP